MEVIWALHENRSQLLWDCHSEAPRLGPAPRRSEDELPLKPAANKGKLLSGLMPLYCYKAPYHQRAVLL